uniref:U-box domain-containing protein n=1 Tax=Globodera pallida TaxID=36090 RepID=A0A183BMK6_GLOPA
MTLTPITPITPFLSGVMTYDADAVTGIFVCEQRVTCPATAKLLDVERLVGYLGPKDHNHGAAPSRRDAEIGRERMKKQVKENPAAKTSRLRADVRAEVDDEEEEVARTLDGADFDNDLMDTLHLLGLVMQGDFPN